MPLNRSIELNTLERYYSIVDDDKAFAAAARRSQPLFMWTNTLRTASRQLVDVLTLDGCELTPLEWHRQAYRVSCQNGNGRLGSHWSYLAGWFHIQEASSMIPALLLDPQPGERVLDLCAAPGNKTALTAWAGQSFRDELRHTIRIWLANLLPSKKTRPGPATAAVMCWYVITTPFWASGFMMKIKMLSPVCFLRAGSQCKFLDVYST